MVKKTSICLYISAAAVTLAVIVLTIGFTILKPKNPITTVDSISISDLHFKINLPKLRPQINLTLDANVTVKNPNLAGFKYDKTSAVLRYRGNDVGEILIPAGNIPGSRARRFDLRLALMADRILAISDLSSDAVSGTLPLQVYLSILGKVRLLVSVRVIAAAACDFEVHLIRRSVVNQTCRYKTKL
ncbi:hypothetical protein CASFOL_019041 [Castilleja foliolosa]|uniref:Late embryogenesis abundant protein LEA-2 subgroup domain-containing protein n=1 Tax=Castilleja foliolosa TaxID=1961234 RepID=A0ABD3D4V5_9LAMI